jgi:DNA modification methylase
MKIINGNSLEVLKRATENSIDAVVTDPPYGLSFMGKKWDYDVPSTELWEQVFRVLKPGGHLLSFAGSRTYHRMAVNIEDAGFEIRDQIMWVYGSGFPKSHNIGKSVDKLGGNTLGKDVAEMIKQKRLEKGYSTIKLAEIGGFYGKTNHGGTVSNWETGNGSITPEQFNKLIEILQLEDEPIIASKRELLKVENGSARPGFSGDRFGEVESKDFEYTKGSSPYEGWGTALKPAHEPIVVARKPLSEKTIAKNVLEWGTGGINIDGCRVEADDIDKLNKEWDRDWNNDWLKQRDSQEPNYPGWKPRTGEKNNVTGRFPANFIHDGSDEVVGLFPDGRSSGKYNNQSQPKDNMYGMSANRADQQYDDSGSASRFFYCAKASKKDRNEGCEDLEKKAGGSNAKGYTEDVARGLDRNRPVANFHPTVKPTALMQYLVRLVTPKGGTVLDPFMGSGSTGKACKLEGFDFIGIELDEEYCKIAQARIDNA